MTSASFKKARIVWSSWLEQGGRRLDCNPYMSGAQEARDALKKLVGQTKKLNEVTLDIFDSGRHSRNWVADPSYGIRYMGSTAISLADLTTLPLISKKQVARNPKLLVEEGWSLITRSGTIGRMAYVRSDMAGLACSEDVLRVVPDTDQIAAGYLYAFLSSKYGVPLVVAGTYGAIIQHVESEHIASLDVPRFSPSEEREIHSKVVLAAELRARAAKALQEVAETFDGLFPELGLKKKSDLSVSSVSSNELRLRMDAEYHNPRAVQIRKRLATAAHVSIDNWCDEIFLPGIFKRIHVEDTDFSAPYFTGYSLYWNEPEPKGYLSKATKLFDQVSLREGMILIQAFGQEGGLTGKPVWVGRHLDKATTTHMLVRLIVEDRKRAAYLYGFLNSLLAYRQISCLTYGGSIPHFDVAGINTVLVPRLSTEKEEEIALQVLSAIAARDEALQLELDARKIVESLIQGAQ